MAGRDSRAEAGSGSAPELQFSLPKPWRLLVGWGVGLAVLLAFVGAVLHFGDLQAFLGSLRHARPSWLALAALCQCLTYVCAALIWRAALMRGGVACRLPTLLRLAVIELFMNQAIPTGGLSGSFMVIRGLRARDVPLAVATSALVIAALCYYGAYLAAASLAFALLWMRGDFDARWALVSVLFVAAVVGIVAAVAMVVRRRAGSPTMPALSQWFAPLAAILRNVRTDLLHSKTIIATATLYQLAIFVLDAATVFCAARAVGTAGGFAAAFVGFMLGSVVATLAPIPLGLGTFEATSVAVQHLMGTPIEGALAATLIFRGLSFWLPMVPGLLLVYREAHRIKERTSGNV